MDDPNETHSSIWSKLAKLFVGERDNDEKLEQAILDASEEAGVEPQEKSMLLGILRFNDLQVHDTMIPRTDMDCIPIDASLANCANLIVSSGHSRIPVYRDTRDNIVGMVHAKDILPYFDHDDRKTLTVETIMREPFFVPDTKSTRTLLQEFRERKQHIAIALDEYGGTSGLITIEDVLEEIVGDIEDEHDAPREEEIRQIDDQIYELTGRANLEDLTELGLALENDEVDTIGGYLCMLAGHVPAQGETFNLKGWKIIVLEADPKLIHKLRMEPANLEQHATSEAN
ncbi:MAG: HlyC/CorC family transporter [Desulfovibrionaceae bacterium]|nr:HlyC/CorC family transporter [Desulfovibrionaceae bacterium]